MRRKGRKGRKKRKRIQRWHFISFFFPPRNTQLLKALATPYLTLDNNNKKKRKLEGNGKGRRGGGIKREQKRGGGVKKNNKCTYTLPDNSSPPWMARE